MRTFILKKDWHHPYKTFEAGCIFSANIWATYLGSSTTEEEFLEFYEKGRFKDWFDEFIDTGHGKAIQYLTINDSGYLIRAEDVGKMIDFIPSFKDLPEFEEGAIFSGPPPTNVVVDDEEKILPVSFHNISDKVKREIADLKSRANSIKDLPSYDKLTELFKQLSDEAKKNLDT